MSTQAKLNYNPLRLFLLTLGIACVFFYLLNYDYFDLGGFVSSVFSFFPRHRIQLESTFWFWGFPLGIILISVFLEAGMQAMKQRRYPWEHYKTFFDLGILIAVSHFIVWFIIQPEPGFQGEGFDGEDTVYPALIYIGFLISSSVYMHFKKGLQEKTYERYKYFLLSNFAVVAGIVLYSIIAAFLPGQGYF